MVTNPDRANVVPTLAEADLTVRAATEETVTGAVARVARSAEEPVTRAVACVARVARPAEETAGAGVIVVSRVPPGVDGPAATALVRRADEAALGAVVTVPGGSACKGFPSTGRSPCTGKWARYHRTPAYRDFSPRPRAHVEARRRRHANGCPGSPCEPVTVRLPIPISWTRSSSRALMKTVSASWSGKACPLCRAALTCRRGLGSLELRARLWRALDRALVTSAGRLPGS